MDSNNEAILCEVIIMLLPRNAVLGELYQMWYGLSPFEKKCLEYMAALTFSLEGQMLFGALQKALERWDLVQSNEGAPGNSCSYFVADCPIQEDDIVRVAQACLRRIESITGRSVTKDMEGQNLPEGTKLTSKAEIGESSKSPDGDKKTD